MRTTILSLALAGALPFVALADEAQSREADMFGGEPAASAPEKDGAKAGEAKEDTSREADMFGDDASPAPSAKEAPKEALPTTDEERALERVDVGALRNEILERNDKLQIGGRVFVRSQYSAQTEFDDAVPALDAGTFALQSPNLLDVYLDARPNDRLRAYVRTRSVYDPSVVEGQANQLGQTQQRLRTNIDQLWVKGDWAQKVFFTAGKQRIKWGSGRFWNPTDFLNGIVLDPLAVLDERLGVSLLKLHVPIESLGWNFYAIADLESVTQVEQVGAALRAELLLGPMEVALSAAGKKRTPLRFGLDVSLPVWLFDVHAEGALIYPDAEGVVQQVTDPIDVNDPTTYDRVKDLKGELIPQITAGFDISLPYSDQDSVTFAAEYFFNGLGYEDGSLYDSLFLRSLLQGSLATTATGGSALTPPRRTLGASFQPLYMGRHYVAANVFLLQPGTWNDSSAFLSWLANLSSKSHTVRVQWNQTLLTNLSANVFASYAFGETGDLNFGLRVPAITNPLIPAPAAVRAGFVVNPTVVQVGGGLILSI